MNFEFKLNGEVSLSLRPDHTALEKAFFNELFTGEVEVVKNHSPNQPDEVVIKRKKVEIKPPTEIILD